MPVYEVEFDAKPGRKFKYDGSDAGLDRATKQAGLWKPGQLYPGFTTYEDGEETGGGGGGNSGYMKSTFSYVGKTPNGGDVWRRQ